MRSWWFCSSITTSDCAGGLYVISFGKGRYGTCTYVGDTNGRFARGDHALTHDVVSVQRIVLSPYSDWPTWAVDVVERPQDLVQLERG